MLFKNEIFNLQLWSDSILNNILTTVVHYCGDDDSDIKVFFESPQFSNAGERSIADDGGGHIGTKNPVLNYWNKIYRGSDFVGARQ